MKPWIKLLIEGVGAIAGVARQLAGDDWDDEIAEGAIRAGLRQEPRQAIDDADRAELERMAEGDPDA